MECLGTNRCLEYFPLEFTSVLYVLKPARLPVASPLLQPVALLTAWKVEGRFLPPVAAATMAPVSYWPKKKGQVNSCSPVLMTLPSVPSHCSQIVPHRVSGVRILVHGKFVRTQSCHRVDSNILNCRV